MQIEQLPPKQNLEKILQALKIKNIQQLFSNEHFNIESLAKITNNHKLIIYEQLASIHTIITKPYSLQPNISIKLDPIFKRWLLDGGQSEQNYQQSKWNLDSVGLMEIIGRSNGGKSYFLNEIIIECLKAGQKIIYLDSNNNIQKLSFRIGQQIDQNPQFDKDPWFKHIQFRGLPELSMLLHCIGNCLLQSKEIYFIFIDNIGRSQEPQAQNNQSASSLEYKFVDRFKRILIEVSKLGGVVYAARSNNSNTLFNQTYKSEKHRPKLTGSTAKQWDSISGKTICVDYSRTKQDKQFWRLMSTKSIAYKPLNFTRKCK